jgi:16S rRNA (guanine1516-N2)-methyltransferase
MQDYALAIASLDRNGKNNKPAINMNPYFVDFFPRANSRLGKRASGESGRDLLIKAVGLPNRCMSNVTIYDLTAGFGQDSLLIAKSGASQVYMVERNPIVVCLLKDALRRLVILSETSCISDQVRREASELANRLHLIHDDGFNVAKAMLAADIESRPDVIYLDPMFPER